MVKMSTLVLDLDETVVHTYQYNTDELLLFDRDNYKFFNDYKSKVSYTIGGGKTMYGLYRPGVKRFLRTVDRLFDNVIVWSAGEELYVRIIAKKIYEGLDIYPRLVLSRPHCIFDSSGGFYHKPIRSLMSYVKKNSYDIKIDIKRTLILDDKKYTTTDNPNNAVIIPEFAPGQDENWYVKDFDELLDRSDRSLVKFTDWFRTVKDKDDYTKLYKGSIFR